MATPVQPFIVNLGQRPKAIDFDPINEGLASLQEAIDKRNRQQTIEMAYDTYGGDEAGQGIDPFGFQMHLVQEGIDPVTATQLTEPIFRRQQQQNDITARDSVIAFLEQEGRLPEGFDASNFTNAQQVLDLIRGEQQADIADAQLGFEERRVAAAERQADAAWVSANRPTSGSSGAISGGGLRNNATDHRVHAYMTQFGLDPEDPAQVATARVAVDNISHVQSSVEAGIEASLGRMGQLVGDEFAGQRTAVATDIAMGLMMDPENPMSADQAVATALDRINGMADEELLIQYASAPPTAARDFEEEQATADAGEANGLENYDFSAVMRQSRQAEAMLTQIVNDSYDGISPADPAATIQQLLTAMQSDGVPQAQRDATIDYLIERGILQPPPE